MIIFAVTREGFDELESIIRSGQYPVWIGGDVLTNDEIEKIRSLNVALTNFSYKIDPSDDEALDAAISTISEHHPDERIWLECKPKI